MKMRKFASGTDRIEKARKINAVLEDYLNDRVINKKILDIGTGSGEIADFFSEKNEVFSVDTLDQRKNKISKVKFSSVKSEALPFEDGSFDIIISNFVFEHISDQALHLAEVKRALKKNGVCYFACPNKIFPIEPHYKLPLIHYLPKKILNLLLKKINLYEEDVHLLNYFKIKKMLKEYFYIKEYTDTLLKYPKKFYLDVAIFGNFPRVILKKINFISPSNIYILRK